MMILSTTDVIQGATVEAYLGIVTAEVVYGIDPLPRLKRVGFGTQAEIAD